MKQQIQVQIQENVQKSELNMKEVLTKAMSNKVVENITIKRTDRVD